MTVLRGLFSGGIAAATVGMAIASVVPGAFAYASRFTSTRLFTIGYGRIGKEINPVEYKEQRFS